MTQAQKTLLARNKHMERTGRSARYAIVVDEYGNEIVVKIGSLKYQRYSLGCPVSGQGRAFLKTEA